MNEPITKEQVDAQAIKLARFNYRGQFKICRRDGTAKSMTPELLAQLTEEERQSHGRIWGFQQSRPELYGNSGPLFCGKKTGICSSKHCREIHCQP